MGLGASKGNLMRVSPLRTTVMILRGDFPLFPPSEEDKRNALGYLRKVTGHDFGFDADKWEAWLKVNRSNEYY